MREVLLSHGHQLFAAVGRIVFKAMDVERIVFTRDLFTYFASSNTLGQGAGKFDSTDSASEPYQRMYLWVFWQ